MRTIKIATKELTTARFAYFQESMGVKRAEALGVLALFMAETRTHGVERGDRDRVARCAPTSSRGTPYEVLSSLIKAGYVRLEQEGQEGDEHVYVVVDNDGWNDRSARIKEQCRKASQASHGKAKKKAKPKLAVATTPAPEALTPTKEANAQTWAAYAAAYKRRTGHEPPRNAKSNALIAQFVQRLGGQEAPQVIAWYVEHPNTYYAERLYPLDFAVRDAEALHTQWLRGRYVTREALAVKAQTNTYESRRAQLLNGEA